MSTVTFEMHGSPDSVEFKRHEIDGDVLRDMVDHCYDTEDDIATINNLATVALIAADRVDDLESAFRMLANDDNTGPGE